MSGCRDRLAALGADTLCQPAQGGLLEECRDRQVDAQGVADLGGDLDGEERVSAEGEEVVLDADALDAEKLLPDAGEGGLDLVPRRHVGAGARRARSGHAAALR